MRYHDMNDDEMLRRYLLGRLDAEQADELEQRLLTDDGLFELAEAMEGDLMDAAVRKALPPAERSHVLWQLRASPGGRARYDLVHSLTQIDQEQRTTAAAFVAFRILSRPSLRAAAVAAGLALAAGSAWLATRFAVPRMEDGTHMIARGVPAAEEPEAPAPARPDARPADRVAAKPPLPEAPAPEAPRPEAAPAEDRLAERRATPEPLDWVFQLALTGARSAAGDAIPLLTIPPGRSRVEIRLPLAEEEPATEFSVLLRDAVTGEEIRKDESLAARPANGGRAVVLTVAAADLPEGTYEIEVRAVAPEEDLLGRPTFEVRAP